LRYRVRVLAHTLRFSVLFRPPPPSQLYTLSLHDALPISAGHDVGAFDRDRDRGSLPGAAAEVARPQDDALAADDVHEVAGDFARSEEHTSELQSRENLVCRLLLEKKKRAPPRRGCADRVD